MIKQHKLCMLSLILMSMSVSIIMQLSNKTITVISTNEYEYINNVTNQSIATSNIIFVSSSCYNDYLSSVHLNNINNIAKLNINKNILIFCGTLECIKQIEYLQTKSELTNLFVYRLQLQLLANNTPLKSFLNNHAFNRLKRGRDFINDIQKISILLVLYKYNGLYLSLNYKHSKQMYPDNYFSYEWIHNQSMFVQSHMNHKSSFLYEIMLNINLQYSSLQYSWPLQINIDKIIDNIYYKHNVIKLSLAPLINIQTHYNIKDKHYGILSYDSRVEKCHNANIGDETQTFSGLQFVPFVDTFVDKSNWNIDTNNHFQQDNNSIITFLNAWYGDTSETWPPIRKIDPLLFSMHFVSKGGGLDYFLQYNKTIGAVGARDLDTLQYFKTNGIETYFSGCATLLLQMACDYSHKRKDENDTILVIDVVNKKARNEIIQLIPENIRHKIKYMKQSVGIKQENILKNRMARYHYSYNMIKEIGKAKLLITSRLHSSLPAVAMNTTVLFVHTPTLPGGDVSRLNGFTDLFYNVGINNIAETLSEFNWISPSVNPNHDKVVALRKRMITDIKKFNELYETGVTFGVLPFDDLQLLA